MQPYSQFNSRFTFLVVNTVSDLYVHVVFAEMPTHQRAGRAQLAAVTGLGRAMPPRFFLQTVQSLRVSRVCQRSRSWVA